jgi:hypothetical protein
MSWMLKLSLIYDPSLSLSIVTGLILFC